MLKFSGFVFYGHSVRLLSFN